MNEVRTADRPGIPSWVTLLLVVTALVVAAVALTATVVGGSRFTMMSGTVGGGGMMAGRGMMFGPAAGAAFENGPQPADSGFVAGTAALPRVIRVIAGPGYSFSPSTIAVARGETITFLVTAMGPLVHEFMVGPADAVAADQAGTPEIADIGMMATKSLTVTFDGAGPYAFACHVEGHYEAGMRGTITVVG
jgi:uncharacterized cupredoxin-like copper-binding protein